MWYVVNFIQGLLIALWTTVVSILTFVVLALTWNQAVSLYISSHYLWSPVLLLIAGVRVKVHGLEHLRRKEPAIFVANHESLWDIVALVRVIPLPLFFVAKKELRKVPFMGWTMRAVGMIFIDRSNKETSMLSMREAGQKIAAGKNVISFPEGTRSKTGETGIFKRGSFVMAREGKIPIAPVGISGARKVMPSGSFTLRPGVIHVNIGERIPFQSFAAKEVDQLAMEVREEVIRLKSASI